jgi:iron complex transport system permease protein
VSVRTLVVCLVLLVLALALGVLSLMIGEKFIGVNQVVDAVRGEASRIVTLYVVTWRMPRAVSALVVGALLGCAGAMFQTLTRNPLGSPDIIGFTTGAHTGGVVAILLVGSSYLTVNLGAVVGGLLTAAVVMALSRRGHIQGFRLIIVGIAITSMLASVDTWLILTADLDMAMAAATWGVGSLNGVAWAYATPSLILGLMTLLLAFPLSRPLAQLDLGDDAAQAIGTRPELTRVLTIVLGVLMVSIATTVAGPIAFIALAAPQIGRRLCHAQGTPMTPAVCTGAVLLLISDIVAQHAIPDFPMPVGVVTVSIGGLYLLYLIIVQNRKGTL